MVSTLTGPHHARQITCMAKTEKRRSVTNVFTPQTRAFYSLERLWGDAERLEISDEPA
jgi:hypothetical protein